MKVVAINNSGKRGRVTPVFAVLPNFAALTLLLACFCSFQKGHAQICPPSQLMYVVRDTGGNVINPARLNAPAFIEESVTSLTADAIKEYKERGAKLELAGTGGSLPVLSARSAGCSFRAPVTYRLTLGKKIMNMIFRNMELPGYQSKRYLVDSPPFQQGTFEIDLRDKEGYVAADNWRKVSEQAEAPAPITVHHLRGRIIDAVTKKPVESALVRVETAPPFYGKHARTEKSTARSGAGGNFRIERLRGDLLDQAADVAVFVEHPDYAVGANAYLFHRDTKQQGEKPRFQSRDDIVIELVPLVDVTGSLVDAETGSALPGIESLSIATEYGEGSKYLGGNLQIPFGRVAARPQPDGTFTLKTAPGKNRISVSGKIGEQRYYLVGFNAVVDVGGEGMKDLVLKVKRDSR